MPNSGQETPPPLLEEWGIPAAFHFAVKIDDSQVSFCEVDGIQCSLELEPIHSGGDNYNCYYFPKSRKFEDLVLKRGFVTKGDRFFDWCQKMLTTSLSRESIEPKNLSVMLLDSEGKALMAWNFENAYPVEWKICPFDAMKNELVIETVKLKYYSFRVGL